MPFELIPRKAAKPRMDPNKVNLRSRTNAINAKRKKAGKPGGGARLFYVFAIGKTVLHQIGWDAETRLSVLWGTGADLKKVQIMPDSAGAWTLRLGKTGEGYLSTAALPETCAFADFPDKPVFFEMLAVGHATKPKYLLITLPDGFHVKGAKAA